MTQIFLRIVNMSIAAGYALLAVLLLRLLLKRAPKWIAVALWGIVAVRLVCPFSIESAWSMIPSAETLSPSIMTDPAPTVHTGIVFLNSTVNPMLGEAFSPAVGDSINPLQVWIPILAAIWAVGAVSLLIYAAFSYLHVRRRVATAVRLRDNIYQSERIASPFVLGIVKPRIYLPFGLPTDDTEHVLAHERAHLCRRDHWWKPLGFLLLALHWFNPLMWLGYALLCRDIELACDERVIKTLDREGRADYSKALLSCSVKKRAIAACPLAFGEVGVKARVKSILNYKKPAFWVIVVAIVLCITATVCLLTNPKGVPHDETDANQPGTEQFSTEQLLLMERYPRFFGLDASNGLDIYVSQMAADSYSFILTPYSEELRYGFTDEYFFLMDTGVGAATMRQILATYDVDPDDIRIIPWINPLSSYIGTYWIGGSIYESPAEEEARRESYINGIRAMLFEADN